MRRMTDIPAELVVFVGGIVVWHRTPSGERVAWTRVHAIDIEDPGRTACGCRIPSGLRYSGVRPRKPPAWHFCGRCFGGAVAA